MKTQRCTILLLAVILSACASTDQPTFPTGTVPPTVEPTTINLPSTSTPTIEPTLSPTFTPTNEPSRSDNAPHTVLNIKFPFEPAFPGYLADIKSTVLTANLMCALEQGKTTGEILDLNQSSTNSSTLGICDTSSMTLNVLIPDQITVTIILGGFVVNEVTKEPDSVSGQLIEYSFDYTLK